MFNYCTCMHFPCLHFPFKLLVYAACQGKQLQNQTGPSPLNSKESKLQFGSFFIICYNMLDQKIVGCSGRSGPRQFLEFEKIIWKSYTVYTTNYLCKCNKCVEGSLPLSSLSQLGSSWVRTITAVTTYILWLDIEGNTQHSQRQMNKSFVLCWQLP